MSEGRRVTLLAAAVAVVGAVLWFPTWLTEKRTMLAATPSSAPGDVEILALRPRSQACLDDVVVPSRPSLMRFRVGTYLGSGQPLDVSLTAPGYGERVRQDTSYIDNALLRLPFDAPARELRARVCIRNVGRRQVALYGGIGPPLTMASRTTVDGSYSTVHLHLSFEHQEQKSILGEAGTVASRMARFRPGWMGEWLFWLLAPLVLLGLPALAVWSFSRSV